MLNANDESRQLTDLGSSFAFSRASVTRNRVAVGACLLGIIAIGFVPYQKVIGDGSRTLTVSVASKSNAKMASVSCEAFSSEQDAQQTMEYLLPLETGTISKVADPFRGEPLEIDIGTTYFWHDSLLWTYDSGYFQKQFMVVIVQYVDGRRVGKVVGIPDVRKDRTLKVEIP